MSLVKKIVCFTLLVLPLVSLPILAAVAQTATSSPEESRPSFGEQLGDAVRGAEGVAEIAEQQTKQRQAALEENADTRAATSEEATSNQIERQETRTADQAPRANEQVDRQTTRQAVQIERQTALTDARQQRIKNLAANLSNRAEEAIKRLFVIIDRLESRVSKIEAAGVDVSLAKENLRQATLTLSQARSVLINIDEEVNQATTSNQPYSNWQALQTKYKEAATLIRQSHGELRATVAALKSAVTAATAVPTNPEPTPIITPAEETVTQ